MHFFHLQLEDKRYSYQFIQNMGFLSILLYFFLLFKVSSLHITIRNNQKHAQQPPGNASQNPQTPSPPPNKNQDLAIFMREEMDTFEGKINEFQTYALNAQNTINQQTDIKERIKLYQDLIIHERDELYLMTTKLNIPLDRLAWVCQQLPAEKKSVLIKTSNELSLKLKMLNQTIMTYKNVTEQKSLSQHIQLANQFNTQFMSDFAANSTDTLQPVQTRAISNLLSSNWILGNQTLAQLNEAYAFTTLDNLYYKNCPLDKPFSSHNQHYQCIKCPPNLPYFNLKSGYCEGCQQLNSANHTCSDDPLYNNSNLEVVKNRLIMPLFSGISNFFSKNDVPCPKDKPFFDGQKCIQCPQYFDISRKKCVSCQSNQYYDSEAYQCKQKSITATDFNKVRRIILPTNQSLLLYQQQQSKLDSVYKVTYCPPEKPFFNDYECIDCENHLLFSISYKTCGTCPESQFYNNDTYHCENIIYYSNMNNLNWVSTIKLPTQILTSLQDAKAIEGSRECPEEAPFYNQQQCISCESLEYFSFDSLTCVSCPQNMIFSKNLHRCKEPEEGYFQTNPSTTMNLIYDGRSKSEWMYSYYNNLKNHPQISDCPFQKPYFDGVSCIICGNQKPYFNLGQLLCQSCKQGFTYNSEVNQCLKIPENTQEFNPSLEKLIAGIFT